MTTGHHQYQPMLLSGSFDLLARSSCYDEGHLVGTSMSLMQPAFYYSGFNNVNTSHNNRRNNNRNVQQKVTIEPYQSIDERLSSPRFLESLSGSSSFSWSASSSSIHSESKSKKCTSMFFPPKKASSLSSPPPPPLFLEPASTPVNPLALVTATVACRPGQAIKLEEPTTKPAPRVLSSSNVLPAACLPVGMESCSAPTTSAAIASPARAAAISPTATTTATIAVNAAPAATITNATTTLPSSSPPSTKKSTTMNERQAMKQLLTQTKLKGAPSQYIGALVQLVDDCLFQKAAGDLQAYSDSSTLDERLKTCLTELVRKRCLEKEKSATTTCRTAASNSSQEPVASSSARSFPKSTQEQGVFLDQLFQIVDL